MTSKRIRMATAICGTLAMAATLTMLGSAATPKFFNDDPVWVERDTQDASSMKPLDVDLIVDLTYNVIKGADDIVDVRAQNVNTVDEAPDSSWFTNRIGHRPLTAEDIARGPDTSAGPAAGTWTVTSSKSDGVTPGFTIKDANGQRWACDPGGDNYNLLPAC